MAISIKLINLLTLVGGEEGEDMSMLLLHPGAYLNKVHGAKYVIDLTAISYKVQVSKVSSCVYVGVPAGIMCK